VKPSGLPQSRTRSASDDALSGGIGSEIST